MEKYKEYNKDLPMTEEYNPYLSLYTGEEHYRQMKAALNHDAGRWAYAVKYSGDDFAPMYLMMDHGLSAELCRGKTPQDLVLFSGLKSEQVACFAGYPQDVSHTGTEIKEEITMKSNGTRRKSTGAMRLLTMLAVLAAFLFLMAGCGSGDTEETEATEATEAMEAVQEETTAAENWYDSLLADASVTDEYPYYRLLDIDQDGTDELFLSSTEKAFIGNEDKAKMMAFVDGEAATIKEIGGAGGESFSYDASDKSLFYFSRLSGEEHIIKYAYENGELTEEQTGDEYDDGHDPQTGSNTEDTYYLDGKKVTEREADVLWDQFDDRAMPITYSTDGQGSPFGDDDADEPDDGDDDGDDD